MTILWSRIQDTNMAKAAHLIIRANTRAHYHNSQHIEALYEHLANTNEPYSETLDWAVLFHDIVYDEKPNKELRSALQFMKMRNFAAFNCSLTDDQCVDVFRMIMNTETHTNLECPMVRADLHQLADPVHVMYNFMSLMKEAQAIYGVDEVAFANATEQFMYGLMSRVCENLDEYTPHKRLWDNIVDGIDSTIQLALMIQGK